MGLAQSITSADFSANDARRFFDIRSERVVDISYIGNNLRFRQNGDSTFYFALANNYVRSATVTTPADSPLAVNAIVMGTTTDGGYCVLYLTNPDIGQIKKFHADGNISSLPVLFDIPSDQKPSRAKGQPFTLTITEDRFIMTYTGFEEEVLFADIDEFYEPCIGVLATTNDYTVYTFVINE